MNDSSIEAINWSLASAAPAPNSITSMIVSFLPIVLIIGVFYFLLIRPQQKRQKVRLKMLANLKKGDKVITIGGIYGTIVELTDDKAVLLVNDVTKITCLRQAVESLVEEPVSSAS